MSKPKSGFQLTTCPTCQGAGESRGVFHQLTCIDCQGLGEVRDDNGEALEDNQIITRLRERNRQLLRKLQAISNANKQEPTQAELQSKWRGA